MNSAGDALDRKEAIYNTHILLFVHVARIQEDDEMVYLIIDARGSDDLGYIAALDIWFSSASGKFQFYRCIDESKICETLEEAMRQARLLIPKVIDGNPLWILTGL